MALTVLLTQVGGTLQNAQVVEKSWPGFYDTLRSLGILIEEQEDAPPDTVQEEEIHGTYDGSGI